MARLKILLLLAFPFLMGSVIFSPLPTVTPDELIYEVNALRANRGLAPYQVDSWLMSYAQEHAEYLASTGQGSHVHSDGSRPSDIGLTENVASYTAGYIDSTFIVYEIWADPIHMNTMVGYSTGSLGVGVASNGEDEWFTLDVRPGEKIDTGIEDISNPNQNPAETDTPIPIEPLRICTPQPDGSVVHTVGYGQTLWSIAQAYGVTMERLKDLNPILAANGEIFAGQKLLVKLAPKESPTAEAPTLEPSPTATLTPNPSDTVVPTQAITVTDQPTSVPTATIENQNTPEDNAQLSRVLTLTALILAGMLILYIVLFRGQKRY